MKTLMITVVLLLVGLVTAQQTSTTPKYFAPAAGGPNININDPNVNINDPNVNINDPNFAQPAPGAVGGGGQFSSSSFDVNGVYAGNNSPGPSAAGGQSNSAEGGLSTGDSPDGIDENDGSDAGSVLNLDGADGDAEASSRNGVNTTALGVVLAIMIVLGIFGVVAVILIRQRRQNAS